MNATRRGLMGGAGVSLAFGEAARAQRGYDAVVGEGGHASVAAALADAPKDSVQPWRILVRRGRWKEKLTVDKPNIRLIGESRTATVLDFDAAAGQPGPDGRPWGTFRSASLTIAAPGCGLSNLTVSNSFDYVAARRDPASSNAGNGLQAVALALLGEADRVLVEDVDLESWQDTLLTNVGRSLFRNCTVFGAVDYIFGGGTALFERCRIVTRGRPGMSGARQGYITAPSTRIGRDHGLVFDRCRLEKTPGLTRGSIALGRPWRAGLADAVGQAVFLRCWMDDHIDAVGWDRMSYGRDADGELLWFNPEQARFFEYESRGPGAARTPQRRQLTPDQARWFDRERVLGDWRI